MARTRPADRASAPLHRTLSTPGVFLARMLVFLLLIALIGAILYGELATSFKTNPFLNSLILAVLLIGIIYMFGQVLRLYPEIKWVNAFRIADPGLAIEHRPSLLAPMATMLRARTGSLSLSTAAMRTIMDSIASRLDEARDTGRYLVGLLVFLGLLGTFWGLLETIQSVGATIGSLDAKGGDGALMFEELKSGLAAPLKGMGTAFAASLFGLSGSLILGFLDLQASQAHNRFYNELEEWLSGITDLTPAGTQSASSGDAINRNLYLALGDLQRSIDALTDRLDTAVPLGAVGPDGRPLPVVSASAVTQPGGVDHTRELAQGVHQLVTQLRGEQQVVRQWLDEQSHQSADRHSEVTAKLDHVGALIERKG